MSDLTPQQDFSTIVALIQERRLRVTRLVNRELIDLYWEIGKYLDERIDTDGWGKGTVHQLAEHLLGYETGLRGFSASNLWRMRQFYQTWRSAPEELATLLRELQWSAHVDPLGRCGTDAEREFYLRYAVRENHSVRDLRRAIDTATFERVALADEKLATVSRVFPKESRPRCGIPTPASRQKTAAGETSRIL